MRFLTNHAETLLFIAARLRKQLNGDLHHELREKGEA